MATSIHVLPSPPPVAVEAAQCDIRIRQAIKNYSKSFGSLAHWSWKLKSMDGYGLLGYADEKEYFASLGVSRSWYYHAVAVGQACAHLTEEELCEIPVGTAELMLSVRPKIRDQYQWAEEAKTTPYGQFAQKIEDRNAQIPGENRPRMAVLSIRVPATAKEAILENLETFKERNELETAGQALEYVVADRWDRKNVLALIDQARQALGRCASRVNKVCSDGVIKDHLQVGRAKLEEAYMELVAANREDRRNEIRAKAISAAKPGKIDQDDTGWPDDSEAERGWV